MHGHHRASEDAYEANLGKRRRPRQRLDAPIGYAVERIQTNCQHEPAYPLHHTVGACLSHAELTCHLPSARCAIQEPHGIAQCGEFLQPTTGEG